ncbi:MAG: hypothetical protein AB7W16_09815 [Candidatus Obscuribacterales bacterium]
MTILTNSRKSSGYRVVLAATAVAFSAGSLMPVSAFSVGRSNKASLQMPVNDKIDLDAIPEVTPPAEPEKKVDISPISLDQSTADNTSEPAAASSDEAGDADSADGKALKATVTTDQFIPKGPLEGKQGLLAPTSVKGSKSQSVSGLGGSAVDQANTVNAVPLPLLESADETANKIDEVREIERQQLTALWEATLTRSPDIQFVLQKLMPASDPSRTVTLLMRAVSTAAMGAMSAVTAMNPTPGSYAINNLGANTLAQLLNMRESQVAKKARLSETESMFLFNMVRNTADKLVSKFRDYKRVHTTLLTANSDFEHLKRMAAATRGSQDSAKQIEIEYTLKKQQRDIEDVGSQLSMLRQGLIDMAGAGAVQKLDGEIDEELKKLHPEIVNPEESQSTTMIAEPPDTSKNL